MTAGETDWADSIDAVHAAVVLTLAWEAASSFPGVESPAICNPAPKPKGRSECRPFGLVNDEGDQISEFDPTPRIFPSSLDRFP
jgi:hypothetical protein